MTVDALQCVLAIVCMYGTLLYHNRRKIKLMLTLEDNCFHCQLVNIVGIACTVMQTLF